MDNSTKWDKNANVLFDTTMIIMDHLNSQPGVVGLKSTLFSNPQKLLTCQKSEEVIIKVLEEILIQCLGEKPPAIFLKFIRQKVDKELKAYVKMFDIMRIWDLPMAHLPNLSLSTKIPTKEIDGEEAYLWEGLIDHLGDEPGAEHL